MAGMVEYTFNPSTHEGEAVCLRPAWSTKWFTDQLVYTVRPVDRSVDRQTDNAMKRRNLMPGIPALSSLKYKDLCELEVSLGYKARSSLKKQKQQKKTQMLDMVIQIAWEAEIRMWSKLDLQE